MNYRIPTGTKDLLPADIYKWHFIERKLADVFRRFNYKEIRTPIFEYTDLFKRSIGEATDVVGKEMYTFLDKGEESLTLRPEMTASVMRAFIENNIGGQNPINKFYYIGPMFRQERPQKGRYRQFHQFGVEALGSHAPEIDVETMLVALTIYEEIGIQNLQFKINSVGCSSCRPSYRAALVVYLTPFREKLSAESQKRLLTNPMRILDSKNPTDQEIAAKAPYIKDYLCEACSSHFTRVQSLLQDSKVKFEIDGRLVRGLDYYTKTAYEIQSTSLGSQNALGGGGRYDLLAEELGGKSTPAVGFAAGIERLLIVMEAENLFTEPNSESQIYFMPLGEKGIATASKKLFELRRAGFACEMDYLGRSLKAQMRDANRLAAPFVVILGDSEIEQNIAVVKNMSGGEQSNVSLDKLSEFFSDKF